MSLVIPSNREGSCGICLDEFSTEARFTHIGGENHDAFHKQCLIQWLKTSDKCPWDQRKIDRTSPMLKRGWMIDRLRPAIINGAIACFSSFSGSIITTLGARTLPIITSATPENGALVAGGLAMAAAGTGVMKQSMHWTLGACLILLSQVAKWQSFSDEEILFMFIAMMVELIGMNQMLNLFDIPRIARQNIGFGVFMSGLAMLPFPSNTPQAIAATALFAGVVTASMGLIRRGE